LTLILPFETETLTEAVADSDPARALEKLEADAVPPPLTLTWLDADTDTLLARAVGENNSAMRMDAIGARRILLLPIQNAPPAPT
jgi:hypothetical protein